MSANTKLMLVVHIANGVASSYAHQVKLFISHCQVTEHPKSAYALANTKLMLLEYVADRVSSSYTPQFHFFMCLYFTLPSDRASQAR